MPDINQPNNPQVDQLASIKAAVKAQLEARVEEPLMQLIGGLVDKEITRRSNLLLDGYNELLRIEKEINSIRPKSPGYDTQMNKLPEVFTSDDKQKIDKLNDRKTKINQAVAKASAALPDYQELINLLKKD